jgi:hypothetical protein
MRIFPGVLLLILLGAVAPALGGPGHVSQKLALKGDLKETVRGDLDGDGRTDLVAACAERRNQTFHKTYHVFLQKKDGFGTAADYVVPIPHGAAAVTTAHVWGSPADDLVWVDREGIWALSGFGESRPPRPVRIFKARTFFRFASPSRLVRLDIARDLDGDGKTDLLVPQKMGYLVAFATAPGKWERVCAVRLGGKSKLLKHTNPIFETDYVALKRTLPVLVPADFNGDGLLDLLALEKPSLKVFLQHRTRGFPVDPSVDARLGFLERKESDAEMDLFESKLLRIHDINRDGRADLIYTTTHGKIGIFSSIKTSYALFLGREDAFYPELPDRLINVPGVALLPEFTDYDADGDADLLVASVRTDLFQGVKAVVVKEVSVSNFLFLCGTDGLWAREPAFEEEVSFATSMIDKGELAPRALFRGDFNGDGFRDKLEVAEDGALAIYPGKPREGAYGFASDPARRIPTEVSADFEVDDMNADRVSDILFYHPDRIVVVLSRR